MASGDGGDMHRINRYFHIAAFLAMRIYVYLYAIIYILSTGILRQRLDWATALGWPMRAVVPIYGPSALSHVRLILLQHPG